MNEVKWIKINVDFLDGFSFKSMRKAKVDGVADLRDKLESVWFELLALAGRINNGGNVISSEIPYKSFDDIATMLERTEKEIELCMDFYLKQGMITFINDCYQLSNWSKYQNTEELMKLQNNDRQRRFRENHPEYYSKKPIAESPIEIEEKKEIVSDELNDVSKNNVISNVIITENNALDKNKNKNKNKSKIRLEEDLDVDKNKEKNIKNNKSKKGESFDEVISRLVKDEEVGNKLIEFIKMRKVIKHPLTSYALELIIKKLEKLSGGDKDYQLRLLDNSISNSWQDIYDLRIDEKTEIERLIRKKNIESGKTGEKIDLDKILGDDIQLKPSTINSLGGR